MDWLKLHTTGILRGSLSASPNTVQLIWVKMLAMAGETRNRDGYLRLKEGEPYSMDYIATVCKVSVADLMDALTEFLDDVRDGHPRIEFADDGSIQIMNWESYQAVPEAKKKLSARELELVERKKLHYLTERYPQEAMATPSVRKKIDDMLKGVK